jgi:hypothetical protein
MRTYVGHEVLYCVPISNAVLRVFINGCVAEYIIIVITQIFQQYLVQAIIRISAEID